MKIVKLGSRYVLAKYGFTHALRFKRQCKESDAIKRALFKIYEDAEPWNQWWKYHNQNAPWGYYKNSKSPSAPYWIGVKKEADLTTAILIAEVNNV